MRAGSPRLATCPDPHCPHPRSLSANAPGFALPPASMQSSRREREASPCALGRALLPKEEKRCAPFILLLSNSCDRGHPAAEKCRARPTPAPRKTAGRKRLMPRAACPVGRRRLRACRCNMHCETLAIRAAPPHKRRGRCNRYIRTHSARPVRGCRGLPSYCNNITVDSNHLGLSPFP